MEKSAGLARVTRQPAENPYLWSRVRSCTRGRPVPITNRSTYKIGKPSYALPPLFVSFSFPMFCKLRLYFLSILAAVSASATHATRDKYFIPGAVQNGTSHAQFVSSASLNAPKVHPINASAFDWWCFDVVSTNSTDLSSVVVIFFMNPQSAFPFLPPSDSITTAYIYVSFSNGTLWSAVADADSATP